MTKEECFGIFAVAMEEDKVYMNGSLSVADICRRIGIAQDLLEDYLHETFGLSGGEIVDIYRRSMPLSMFPAVYGE